MRVEGKNIIKASQQQTREYLQNPEVSTKVTPDCQEFRRIEENKYEAVVKLRVGPVCKKPWRKHLPVSSTLHCHDICLYRDLCGESEVVL